MEFDTHHLQSGACVDTVRALHQTIVSLRAALEKSRSEILELKSKSWPADTDNPFQTVAVGNHVLRSKLSDNLTCLNADVKQKFNKDSNKIKKKHNQEKRNNKIKQSKKLYSQEQTSDSEYPASVCIATEGCVSKSVENLSTVKLRRNLSKSQTVCYSSIFDGDKQISSSNSLHINKVQNNLKFKSTQTNNSVQKTTKNNNSKKSNKLENSCKGIKTIEFLEEPLNTHDIQLSKNTIKKISDWTEITSKEKQRFNYDIYRQVAKSNKKVKTTQKKKKDSRKQSSNINEFISSDTPDIVEIKAQPISEKAITNAYNGYKNDIDDKTIEKKSETFELQTLEKVSLEYIEPSGSEHSDELGKEIEFALFGAVENQNISVENKELEAISTLENPAQVSEILGAQTIQENRIATVKTSDIKKEIIDENIFSGLDLKAVTNTVVQQTVDLDENIVDEITESININKNLNLEENHINKDKPEKDSLDKDTTNNDTINTSGSSALSNLEISVKVFKGNKKPIEVDIKTKKFRKTKKSKIMNDKSQNTSFDDDNCRPLPNIEVQNFQSQNPSNSPQITLSTENIVGNMIQNDVEQEVDDIELIFTTDDTKETDFKEELVPIEPYRETQLLQCPSDYDEKLSAGSDRELEDDVFNDNFENENQENCNFQSQTFDFQRENSQMYNSKSDNSINHEDKSLKSYYSYQDSSFENKSLEKDESFDRFDEKVRIVETDISKIGIQDVEYNAGRRNTCPNPLQYRPIMHREALGRGLNSRKCRPILAHSNVVRKESGAQTDISAVPGSSWRSESNLTHKIKGGDKFTTLPSKFPHPGSRLRLSEKTVEARRVLLSDIGFTSMVPELSRSADHLCPPNLRRQVVSSYGQFLRTTDLYSPAYTSQKFMWTTTTPSEGSHPQSRYSSQFPLSSPPAPTRRCSAPVSPSKRATAMKTTPSKVRFANGSLPELRGDWAAVDSGDSTDSLVEEAEHFLRRSIDCLAPCRDVCFRSEHKQTGVRRASAPEPSRDNVPPVGWQPFLPRIPRDLHLDYWVKVISQEGRVKGGRVRYVGPLMTQTDQFVGVQLSTPDGHSDGTYNNRRYFNCEHNHGIFVPFKKIVMGWRP